MNRTNRNVLAVATLALAPLATALAADPPQRGDSISVTATRTPLPAETTYVTAVHTQLDHQKRYPTGREASLEHPSGTTAVWIELDRAGPIVARGLERTSYSTILDNQALAMVGRSSYGAFPSAAWGDEASHRFRVTYRFAPQNSRGDEQVAVVAEAE